MIEMMKNTAAFMFEEQYQVVAVENGCLVIQGTVSGTVLTIKHSGPETSPSPTEFPPGTLIALSNPLTAPTN